MSQEECIPKILSPKSDIVFKMLLGDENNHDLLINLLETTLEKSIKSVMVLNSELMPDNPEAKKSILDIRAQLDNGDQIGVEIQIRSVKEIRERITFYNDKMFIGQLGGGRQYLELKPSITIVITDDVIIHESDKCHNIFLMLEKDEHFPFNDKKAIHILEMSRIDKEKNQGLLDWLSFIKAEKEEDFMVVAERNPVIEQAYSRLKVLSGDEHIRMLYEDRLKFQRDMWSFENAAREEGLEKGLQEGLEKGLQEGLEKGLQKGRQEGLQKGRQEGLQKGRQKGRQEGRQEEALKIARSLLAKGTMTKDEIAEITGLDICEILKL